MVGWKKGETEERKEGEREEKGVERRTDGGKKQGEGKGKKERRRDRKKKSLLCLDGRKTLRTALVERPIGICLKLHL